MEKENTIGAVKNRGKELFLDIFYDIAGSLLMAIGIFCFMETADIAPGGVSGVAIMLKYLFGVPVGFMSLCINVPLLILAWKYKGRAFTVKTLKTLLFNTVLLDLVVTPYFPQYTGDRMLGSIFGGLFMGAGLALIFMRGSTTGGTDILSYLLELKFPHIPIGTMLMFIDFVILSASVMVFGNIETGLFGMVALFCQTKVIDGVIYGMDKGKAVMIMSPRNQAIANRVLEEIDRGATFLNGRGVYSGKDMEVLYVVVRAPEFHRLKEIVREEDPRAFMTVADASQILGEGFRELKKD